MAALLAALQRKRRSRERGDDENRERSIAGVRMGVEGGGCKSPVCREGREAGDDASNQFQHELIKGLHVLFE